MSVASKVGTFNITTGAAASTVAITDVGFQPTVVIFWWSGLTAASNGDRATHLRGIGWATSASLFGAVCTRDEDAVGTSNTDNGFRTDACIAEMGDGAIAGWADLQSFDSGGFTLEIIDAFTTNLFVSYLALGGDSITNAECGVFTATGVAPTNQTVNNSGNFQPSITFLLSAALNANAPAVAADSNLAFGVASSTSNEHVWWGGANSAQTSGDTATYCLAGELFASAAGSAVISPINRAEFVSHNASPGGFTLNWLERSDANRVLWLSIAGGDWAVGDLQTRTDGNDIAVTGLASQPTAILFVSANKAATTADATPAVHDEWSVGAATSPTERAVQHVASRDGNTNMFVFRTARADAVYVNADPANATYTLEGLMDLKSIESDGFTCVMDDVDPVAAFVWYVAAGPAAITGRTTKNTRAFPLGMEIGMNWVGNL